jgi:hypothetical protein
MTSGDPEFFSDLLPGAARLPGGTPSPAHAITGKQAASGDRTPLAADHPIAAPSRTDPVVRAASEVIGGPAGVRLAVGTGIIRALPVLIILAVAVLGVGVMQKQHCRASGWTNPDMYWHACYSDIPVQYNVAKFGTEGRSGLGPVVEDGSLGPPLQAAVMWTVALLVDENSPAQAPRRYFDLSTVVIALALIVLVIVVATGVRRHPWEAAQVALSPILVTVALVSYELLAVALGAAAVLAWARRRPVTAGVLLGLAVSTRPSTAVLGLAVVLVATRAGAWTAVSDFLGAGVLTWLGLRVLLFPGQDLLTIAVLAGAAVLVAVIVSRRWHVSGVGSAALTTIVLGTLLPGAGFTTWAGLGLDDVWRTWKGLSAGYGSVWMIPSLLEESQQGRGGWWTVSALGSSATTVASLLAMMLIVVVASFLALGTSRRPRLASLALFLAAGFLLVAKEVPVQASLMLLPLIAWSGLRWRDHLWWAASEVVYFVSTWMYIAGHGGGRGLPAAFYLVALLWRMSMIAWVGYQAGRHWWHPETDPIRSPGDGDLAQDDPLGGPVDGSDDAVIVRVW